MSSTLWDYVEQGWDYATGAAEKAYDIAEGYYDKAATYYEGSRLDKAITGVSNFLDTDLGKTATKAATALYGKTGAPQFGAPKGSRLSGGARSSVSSGTYKASAVDLGYTSKVQNAIRAAQNARAGTAIQQTVAKLQTRPARGPLIQIGASPIKVAPRARG